MCSSHRSPCGGRLCIANVPVNVCRQHDPILPLPDPKVPDNQSLKELQGCGMALPAATALCDVSDSFHRHGFDVRPGVARHDV